MFFFGVMESGSYTVFLVMEGSFGERLGLGGGEEEVVVVVMDVM